MKDRFKLLRKTLKLKMREMAERLNIDTSSIGKWESGRQVIPDTRIYQICKEFNVRREWLEKGEGEMFEPERQPDPEGELVREAAYSAFSQLPPNAKDAVLTGMRAFLNAMGNAEASASENPVSAIQGFVNNGTNYGQQSVKFEK